MDNLHLKGVKLAFITALISGLAVFINKFGVSFWSNSSVYTTVKNIIAAVFLTGILIGLKKLPELKALSKKQWGQLVFIGLIGGSVPFLLFFKSITLIPAPEAAFIHKTLFIWVALLALPLLKERLSLVQVSALGILFIGVFLFGAPKEWTFGMGSLMALGATVLWSIENIIAKKVLVNLSSITVGWARMFIGAIFLLIYLSLTGNLSGIIPSSTGQIAMTALVGFILFTFVFSWYSALKHAPATIVSSILVIAAPITTILNGIFITHQFPTKIIIPSFIMLTAVLIISKQLGYLYSKLKDRNSTSIQA